MMRPQVLVLVALLSAPPAHAFGLHARSQVDPVQQALAREPLPADAAALHARLDLALALRPADPLVQELRLHRLLLALREQPPDAALRAALTTLTKIEPLAWTTGPDPDHGRGLPVPVADLAAAARGTLRHWELRERALAYRRALEAGAPLPAPIDAPALAAAVAQVSDAALDALLAGTAPLPTEALAVAAARRPLAAAFRRLFAAPVSPATYPALAQAAAQLPAAAAVDVLIEASRRPELASAAVLALRPLAQRDEVQRFLLAQLGDAQRGGSAAQLLIELPGARPGLEQVALSAGDDPAGRRARAVLGRLDGAAP